jgi:hypothetical protein
LWNDRRKYRYSFQGLITEKRGILIKQWLDEKLNQQINLQNNNNLVYRIKRKIFSKFGFDTTKKRMVGELLLWESDRGRKFPIKAWDNNYYKVLANSDFVLCPSGDCIWSYRFFESILCGAIPIVEKNCIAYEGFRFFTFKDRTNELKWSLEDAEYNYQLCVKKLTIPPSILNNEITHIINTNG